jgi:UPF0176 protein
MPCSLFCAQFPDFPHLSTRKAAPHTMPFRRMKVRLKKEIVTMGVPDIDPLEGVGAYVDPKDWNALISDPETVVIDTRNDYEVGIGTFKGAVNPETSTFRQFPEWVETAGLEDKTKPIAMFCTGGIRCEKATAFMRAKGFENVYHLKGGILKYLEEMDQRDSLWEGSCFVFDERVSVTHGLREGDEILCRACRNPVTPEEQASPLFEEGASCPHCYHVRSDEDRERFRARHRQMLAAKRRRMPKTERHERPAYQHYHCRRGHCRHRHRIAERGRAHRYRDRPDRNCRGNQQGQCCCPRFFRHHATGIAQDPAQGTQMAA